MSTSRKTSTLDRIFGLMIIAGFMLLITALPLGVALCLQDDYRFHSDWPWAIRLGAVMAGATAIVGGVLLGMGEFVVRRRRTRDEKTTLHEALEYARAGFIVAKPGTQTVTDRMH